MSGTGTHRAVFLDRDGTVNVEKEYLFRPEEFEFLPGAPEAIAALRNAGFKVIVVSNQSGVARGLFDPEAVDLLHDHIQKLLLPFQTQIDRFYFCPHHPTEGVGSYRIECDCRKGQPGMLLQASRELEIDLSRSYMVGDKASDVEAGTRAGCHPLLVMTGYGKDEMVKAQAWHPVLVENITAAAQLILASVNIGTLL